MCASSGTKFSSMNLAVSSLSYDSASSRAHAPQAGAALKSTSNDFLFCFASASAASPIRTSSRSEEHTPELQSHRDLHSFPTRRSSDLPSACASSGCGAEVDQQRFLVLLRLRECGVTDQDVI